MMDETNVAEIADLIVNHGNKDQRCAGIAKLRKLGERVKQLELAAAGQTIKKVEEMKAPLSMLYTTPLPDDAIEHLDKLKSLVDSICSPD